MGVLVDKVTNALSKNVEPPRLMPYLDYIICSLGTRNTKKPFRF